MDSELDTVEDQLIGLEDLELDCNGITDLLSVRLSREGIPHRRKIGRATRIHNQTHIFPHCWIELGNGSLVDLRLRKYFPYMDEDRVPHGIIEDPGMLNFQYVGSDNPEKRLCTKLLLEIAGWPEFPL